MVVFGDRRRWIHRCLLLGKSGNGGGWRILFHRALGAGSADFAHEMDIGRYKSTTVRYLSERERERSRQSLWSGG